MNRLLAGAVLLLASPVLAQTTPKADPFAALSFLEGSWQANAQGPSGTTAGGTYSFMPELDGHILARHGRLADCKAVSTFDCAHGDLLYIFAEQPGAPLKAIYFDSEGHVLHYAVTTPSPTSVVFLTDAAQPGPQFRLTYELRAGIMAGSFQVRPPGQTEFRSYLEWSGGKINQEFRSH